MSTTLNKLHEIEYALGRDLTDQEGDNISEYLDDDPVSSDANYLVELFGLKETIAVTSQTKAQQLADLLGNDGSKFYAANGDSLDELAEFSGATTVYGESYWDEEAEENRVRECGPEHTSSSLIRYEFPDGSALVVAGECWDIEAEGRPWVMEGER